MTITSAPPGSIDSTGRRRARFLDRPVRNILLAAASLVTISVAALFVTASPGAAAVSFSLSSYSIPGHNIVVYGKVTNASQQAVGNAQVEVYRIVNGDMRVLRQVRTRPDGLYRVVLNRKRGAMLHVKVSKRITGTHYAGATKFLVHRGEAYGASAQLVQRGSVLFLPIFNY
jgi:hypothetical protein